MYSWPRERNAKTHHLSYNERLYPVKHIVSLAHKYAGKGELKEKGELTSFSSRQILKRLGFRIISQQLTNNTLQQIKEDIDIAKDIENILSDKLIDKTTRQTLIDARIGQGKFRSDIMTLWNEACSLSGCITKSVLRASHIKPWKECSNKERLDPNNGLLLMANFDALFDRGLISLKMMAMFLFPHSYQMRSVNFCIYGMGVCVVSLENQ